MDGYVSKPIRAAQLYEVIAGLLGGGGPAEDVFDRDAALAGVEGDHELLRRMCRLFLADCPGLLQQTRDFVARRDVVALQRAAHKLKGSVGNFAAQNASNAVSRLEAIDLAGDPAGSAEAQAVVEVAVNELQAALGQFLKEPPS